MSEPTSKEITFSILGKPFEGKASLPQILQASSRAADGVRDPFINENVVQVHSAFELYMPGRGAPVEGEAVSSRDQVIALEAADGTTIFMRADKLEETLRLLYPEAVAEDGSLRLDALRDRDAAARGVTDWLWSKLTVLNVTPDDIIDTARKKALEWARERLGDAAGEKLEELARVGVTWLGTKALMWAVESKLARGPGLYRWMDGGELRALHPDELADDAANGPVLVFIHGTGSCTEGSFGDLRASTTKSDWNRLVARYGQRIYAFEHRTLSESPIENALQLAKVLPKGAKVSLVTHSRGGLVGDLMCLGGQGENMAGLFTRGKGMEEADAQDQKNLRDLYACLNEKNFLIERYARIASPARGTRLASGNFDVFLSGLLTLIGRVPALVGSPLYSAFKRVVLEIAKNRTDPRLVPGLEAVLPESPMCTLLAKAERKQGVQMAVITGDIEGGGLLKRLGVLFTDWMFFDMWDNDLVVDTDSMYEGLGRAGGTRYLFDQGPDISHFHYFQNRRTRTALRDWLTAEQPEQLTEFEPMDARDVLSQREKAARDAQRSLGARGIGGKRPVVIVLPGIMGSHLEIRKKTQQEGEGDRVWFDFMDLTSGGLGKIRMGKPDVEPEALFDMFYGSLCKHLEATHEVVRFPYDWRNSVLTEEADRLAQKTTEVLRQTDQPVRLLAHSMGGLVVRAMIHRYSAIWDEMAGRRSSRLVMLGTPNNGSHLMVETLLGKTGTVRNLARADLIHKLQDVLDIVGGFTGALQLLPRPQFVDTGNSQKDDYFQQPIWEELKDKCRDRWFGDKVAAVPSAEALAKARALWDALPQDIPNADCVAYVFGQAANTPCGIVEDAGQLRMLGTPKGDGSVTWDSGRLSNLPDDHYWYMPAQHGDLADTEDYFPAIAELLQRGVTTALPQKAPAVRAVTAPLPYDAGPTPYPTEEELARGLLGGRGRRRKARSGTRVLQTRICAMDLRFAQLPILCGHYRADPIAGAEAQLDRYVVDGDLTQRERLGLYVDEIGTSTIVLRTRREDELRTGSSRGALVVGLGEFGKLSAIQVTEAVRAGVLRFLLHWVEGQSGPERMGRGEVPSLGLASLLIGYNSTTSISIEDSITAIIRGVCEANHRFAESMGDGPRIGRLDFVELFLDNAISAAHALPRAADRLNDELRTLGVRIDPASELTEGEGVRPRLNVAAPFGYWPRLIVTDADRSQQQREEGTTSPLPLGRSRERLTGEGGQQTTPEEGAQSCASPSASSIVYAERMRFLFLSERARAESVMLQRQPGLVETLVSRAIARTDFQLDLSRTLFQLLVPVDFKAVARHTERLVLVVDGYTANLPWEMMLADNEPLILHTAMVRQLATSRFRLAVPTTTAKRIAYVVGNPSTKGFAAKFCGPVKDGAKDPESLAGAEEEARIVANLLQQAGYTVQRAMEDSEALDVINKLYLHPYRIIHIAAHGIHEARGKDGKLRSGVILSDGLLLTAAEIGQMEVVPEVVFLNCCHLAKTDPLPTNVNRLAYSISRELIEMGVRCVIAAGWAVDDGAARTFAETFYTELLQNNLPFGLAVQEARKATFQNHPGCNTWGAYQAYGDPAFVMNPGTGDGWTSLKKTFVSSRELTDALCALSTQLKASVRGGDAERRTVPKQMTKQLKEMLKGAPKACIGLPEVQCALGTVYAELGADYFEQACEAYERAIAGEDKRGRAPVMAIEQLANLEARTGETRGDARLIGRAIRRLQALLKTATSPKPNVERLSLLGSAYKRLAAAQARNEKPWEKVKKQIELARKAYYQAEPAPGEAGFAPYPVLNRLQLDALLGGLGKKEKNEACELARQCATVARANFARSGDFYDAVMPADAELARHLLQGTVAQNELELVKVYERETRDVPVSSRQFDSVVKQIRLLASFLALRGDAVEEVKALERLAEKLAPSD